MSKPTPAGCRCCGEADPAFLFKLSPPYNDAICANCRHAIDLYGVCPHQTGKATKRPDSDRVDVAALELIGLTDAQLETLRERIGSLQAARTAPAYAARMAILLNPDPTSRHTP